MANKTEKITEALTKLDPTNDNHWTAEGAPRLETLRMLAGDPSISREDVNGVNQGLTRQSLAEAVAAAPPAPPAPVASVAMKDGSVPDPKANIDVDGIATATKRVEQAPHVQFNAMGKITNQIPKDLLASLTDMPLETIVENIAEAEQALAGVNAELSELTGEKAKIQTALDVLYSMQVKLAPPAHLNNQSEIAMYLSRQQSQRNAMAEQMGELGMRALPIANRSLLDQRLRQKNRPTAS